MDLRTSEGSHLDVSEALLSRLLADPPPLVALEAPGVLLVSLHLHGPRYRLLHWNGRCWRAGRAPLHRDGLAGRFRDFLRNGRCWSEGISWEPLRGGGETFHALHVGSHVFLTYSLTLGGFALGAWSGVAMARQLALDGAVWIGVLAACAAPPLAIAGQRIARAVPGACDRCGEAAIPLQVGRFSYLCPACGRLNITRWGLHRGPMAP